MQFAKHWNLFGSCFIAHLHKWTKYLQMLISFIFCSTKELCKIKIWNVWKCYIFIFQNISLGVFNFQSRKCAQFFEVFSKDLHKRKQTCMKLTLLSHGTIISFHECQVAMLFLCALLITNYWTTLPKWCDAMELLFGQTNLNQYCD